MSYYLNRNYHLQNQYKVNSAFVSSSQHDVLEPASAYSNFTVHLAAAVFFRALNIIVINLRKFQKSVKLNKTFQFQFQSHKSCWIKQFFCHFLMILH